MGLFNNLLTSKETFELNYELKLYLRVILCITTGIFIYSILKKIIDRTIYNSNLNLCVKIALSVLLIYFITML